MKELAAHLSAVVYLGSKCSPDQSTINSGVVHMFFFLSRDCFLLVLNLFLITGHCAGDCYVCYTIVCMVALEVTDECIHCGQ